MTGFSFVSALYKSMLVAQDTGQNSVLELNPSYLFAWFMTIEPFSPDTER